MKRKIMDQKTSVTITLPKKWVNTHHLKPGDEINVIEKDHSLVISASEIKPPVKKTKIKIEKARFLAYREFISQLYKAGYDEIEVNFKDAKIVGDLQETSDSIYGVELFNKNVNQCVIKNIYKTDGLELFSHISRMVNIIKTMQNTILQDIKSKKYSSLKQIEQLRLNAYKQRDLILMTIKKQKLFDDDLFPFYEFATNLGWLARAYYPLYLSLAKQKISATELDYFMKVCNYFKLTYKTFSPFEYIKRYNECEKLLQKGYKIAKSQFMVDCIYLVRFIQACDNSRMILSFTLARKQKEATS